MALGLLRVVVATAALLLAVRVALAPSPGGIPVESRALVVVGLLGVVVFAAWARRSCPPRALLLGGLAVGLWVALAWSWAGHVDSAVGDCGSTLQRLRPARDADGACDQLVGDAFTHDIPVMLLAIVASVAAAVTTLTTRSSGRSARAVTEPAGTSR